MAASMLRQQQQQQQQQQPPPPGGRGKGSSGNGNDGDGSSSSYSSSSGSQGLSPYFQAILSRTNDRQRFVTGKYPIIVSIEQCHTRKWLNSNDGATSVVLVNNTQIDKSLASFSRFQWLDDDDDNTRQDNGVKVMSMELLAEIHIPKPGYLQIMPGDGAGWSAATLRQATYESTKLKWNFQNKRKSRSSALYEQLEDLKWKRPYQDRLWVSGFTLTGRKGIIKCMDVDSGHITSVNARSARMTSWPNEIHSVPTKLLVNDHSSSSLSSSVITPTTTTTSYYAKKKQKLTMMEDAVLVSDGFLVPGKDRGGIYVVQQPGHETSEWTVCLTTNQNQQQQSNDDDDHRWFYHRAVWVDLTNDGRQSILTARAKLRRKVNNNNNNNNAEAGTNNNDGSSGGGSAVKQSRPKNGQLVMLEMPQPHRFDIETGTPLDDDGTIFDPFSPKHLPWKERILATGPDVMFNVADMDTTDDTVEVISSQFFDKKVTLHSIQKGPEPRITFSRVIDDRCGSAFGGTFANLDDASSQRATYREVVEMGGSSGTVEAGESFSHLLVTSHECNYVAVDADGSTSATTAASESRPTTMEGDENTKDGPNNNGKTIAIDGGSVFSYRVPPGKDAWKTDEWVRTTVASGFKVSSQLWNVINPGAPGFVYTFHAHKDDRKTGKRPMLAVAGDCAESAYIFRPDDEEDASDQIDRHANYKLMSEIKCGATVGSIAIGYEDLCAEKGVEQEPGYAKLYIPCYEKDKILVFALGSGEDSSIDDSVVDDDGW